MKSLLVIFGLSCFLGSSFGQIEKIEITSEGEILNAFFYNAPGSETKPTIIWMHGLPSKKETGSLELAIELNKHNVNVIAFDYKGLWNKQGIFTVENSQKDLNSVIEFAFNHENAIKFAIDTNRIIVAGHSYGSAMAAISGVLNNKVKEIMCLGLTDLSYIIREFYNPKTFDGRVTVQNFKDGLWGPDKLIQNFDEFILDLTFNNYRYDFVAHAAKLLDNRMLIVVGANDLTAPVEYHFFPLYRKLRELKHPDIQYLITDSGHNFTDIPKSKMADSIASWIHSTR
jgi:pimeloyl-ACP methyl ester carboxylesterase